MYQSENIRQTLSLLGFRCGLQSVDRTRAPYELLALALNQGRWHGPAKPLLKKELEELIDGTDKIDRPLRVWQDDGTSYTGSKDGTDAVAGSVFTASKHMDEIMQREKIQEVLGATQQLRSPRSAPIAQSYGNLYDFVAQNQSRFSFDSPIMPNLSGGFTGRKR